MRILLVVLIVLPFVTALSAYVVAPRVSKALAPVAGAVTFALSVALVPTVVAHGHVSAGGELRVDSLSLVFLIANAFLYMVTSIFTMGYLHAGPGPSGRRYSRRFYLGLNLFCWALIVAPLVNGLALLWIAVEVTTVVSALLVAIDDTEEATEAAWKYILIASMGLGIALLATIVMYYAGTAVFGAGYDISYVKLLAGAHHLPPDVVQLAFMLAVIGFGTKMGLVPMHTWLPDAHSEAPTPVSALLSAALLATSFYAILRYYQITERALGSTYPRTVLLVFGIASLLLAALYLLRQRDLKRMLAYSSIEHMGILAIGMSFGVPLAVVGVLLHVLAHAAAKGTAFFGAGSIIRKFGTKDMTVIRGGISAIPWSGTLFVGAILALSAMPPFGIFRSEFMIVSGGLSDPHDAIVAVLVVLASVAFLGLAWSTTQTMLSPGPADASDIVGHRDAGGAGVTGHGAQARVAVSVTADSSVNSGTEAQTIGVGPMMVTDPAAAPATAAAATMVTPSTPTRTAAAPITKGEVSPWIVVSMLLGIAALVMLGVHLPADLAKLLNDAAHELTGAR